MSGLFPKPPKPTVPNPAPPPLERSSDDIARLAAEQRTKRSEGRASAMLTGGQGVVSSAVRFLGGAART